MSIQTRPAAQFEEFGWQNFQVTDRSWIQYRLHRGQLQERGSPTKGLVSTHLAGMSPQTRRGWRTRIHGRTENGHEAMPFSPFMAGMSSGEFHARRIPVLPLRQQPLLCPKPGREPWTRLWPEGRLRVVRRQLVGMSIELRLWAESFARAGPNRMEAAGSECVVALWPCDKVLFHGHWHDLPFVGLSRAPIPNGRVPIWMAAAELAQKR